MKNLHPKPIWNISFVWRLWCLLWLSLAAPVLGSILVQDSFDYPAGNLAGNNGGTGWAGPWLVGTNSSMLTATVVDVGAAPPAMAYSVPSGGTVQGGNQALDLATTGVNANDRYIYASRQFSPPLAQTFFVGYFLHFKAGSAFPHSTPNGAEALGSFFSSVSAGTENGPDGFNFGPQGSVDNWINREKAGGGTPVNVSKPGTTAAGAINYVVAKFTWDGSKYTKCELWVNPAYGSSATPDSTHLADQGTYTNFNWLYFRGAAPFSDVFRIDEITIGTDWSDVVAPPSGAPPTIAINQPTNHAAFAAGANVALSVTAADSDGSVVLVEYFAGTNKIGQATSSPFDFTWTNPPAGLYQLTAKATDNSGLSSVSGAVNVRVGNVVLMVAGTPPGNAAELAVQNRLRDYGMVVNVVSSGAALPGQINDYSLILISSTSAPDDITKYRDVAVPLLNWEWQAFDGLGMTDDESFSLFGQTEVEIVDAAHPLAAGLAAGVTSIFNAAPAQVAAGYPVAGATIVAIGTDGSEAAALFALEKGDALSANAGAGLTAPERRVGIFLGDSTFTLLNANGLKLFDAAVAWAQHRASLGVRPTIAITQPDSGAVFSAGADVAFTVNAEDADGTVAKVEYFSGTNKIGESVGSPFGFTWMNVPTGRYTVSAKVTDNDGLSAASAPISVRVGATPTQALLVVQDSRGNADENGIKARLEAYGFNVEYIIETNPVPANILDYDLVLISSAVMSSLGKYRDVAVPLMNWKLEAFSALGLADTAFSAASGQTEVQISNPAHPMAGGLAGGAATIFTSPAAVMAAGYPVASATTVATEGSGASVLFGLEKGAALSEMSALGLTAAARRVGIFLGGTNVYTGESFIYLNATGLRLFDAAVAWALSRPTMGVLPVCALTQPADGASFAGGADITLLAEASDADGTITNVEFYVGNTKLGQDTSAPYQFVWTNVAPGPYSLNVRAIDNSGYATYSSNINITVGAYPPTVLFLKANSATLDASDTAMKTRLEAGYGLRVVVKKDVDSQTGDAQGMAMILMSGSVSSGNVGAKFRNVPVPLLSFEDGCDDENLFCVDGQQGSTFGTNPHITIVETNHPLAGGLAAGDHIVCDGTVSYSVSWANNPAASAKIVANYAGNDAPCIFGFEQGDLLIDGLTLAPARRVHHAIKDQFQTASPDGLKLFDAALNWLMNTNLVMVPLTFNRPVLGSGGVTLSWTGLGTLEEADQITGPWSIAASQTNPQTVPAGAPKRFYRLRR